MRRRILGMIGAVGITAGSVLLSVGGVASASSSNPGPGYCPPPGQSITKLLKIFGPPGQVVPPGQIVSTLCAPGSSPF